MAPEDRRAMIVAHALPLIAEHGAAVTTQLIAQTAGIGEATIFRAFDDKAALFRACMAEAVRTDPVVEALAEIPLDAPVELRLGDVATVLVSHFRRVGTVMEALVATGLRPHRDLPEKDAHRVMHAKREEALARIGAAIAAVLEPDAARFRVPVDSAAMSFQFLLMTLIRTPSGGLDVPDVIDLFLHGALDTVRRKEDSC